MRLPRVHFLWLCACVHMFPKSLRLAKGSGASVTLSRVGAQSDLRSAGPMNLVLKEKRTEKKGSAKAKSSNTVKNRLLGAAE